MGHRKRPSSNKQFQAILEHIVDGVAVQDMDAEMVYVNPAAARMLGFASPQAAVAAGREGILRDFDLFDGTGHTLPVELLPGRQALKGVAAPVRIVRVRPHQDDEKTWRWAWVKASPILDKKGRPEFVVSVFQEITALKDAELDLRKANQRITKLLEQVLQTSESRIIDDNEEPKKGGSNKW